MPSHRHVFQQADTLGESPVRMERGKAENVVEALDIDLATTFVLYHQFRKRHWTIAGDGHHGLTHVFRRAADYIVVIADDLANRIHALGDVPHSGPVALERHSPVPFEGENVYDGRTSLANDLQAYGNLVERVSRHIELAESDGDHATGELLSHHLVVLEEYAHVLNRFLREDSLTPS